MSLLLAFFLLAPGLAHALSPADTKLQNQVYRELRETIQNAPKTMPPCEAHRALLEAIARHEPPASCARALPIFRRGLEMQSAYVAACEDLNRYADALLEHPAVCHLDSDEYPKELRDELKALRERVDGIGSMLEPFPITDAEWEAVEEQRGTGEFADWRCAIALTFGMQARKSHSDWLQRHRGLAESAATTCNRDSLERSDYESFLRSGFKGYRN